MWEVSLDVTRGTERFTAETRVDVFQPRGTP
jgi:hypothetical protein